MRTVRYPLLSDLLCQRLGSLKQREIGDLCGVSQAAVSKWMAGYDRPRPLQAAQLALAGAVDPTELAKACGYHESQVVRLFELMRQNYAPGWLEFAEQMTVTLHKGRISGAPEVTLEQIHVVIDYLRKGVSSLPARYSYQRRLFELLAKANAEAGRIYSEALPISQAIPRMLAIVRELDEIATSLDDPRILAYAYTIQGSIHYLQGSHERSYFSHSSALKCMSGNPEWESDITRAAAVAAGQIRYRKALRQLQRTIHSKIDRGMDDENAAYMLEGLARGEALSGLSDAVATMELVRKLGANGSHGARLRQIQTARTDLFVSGLLSAYDPQRLADRARELSQMAIMYGYHRYAADATTLIQRVQGQKR